MAHVCAYRHLVDGLLQPQADERGQGVVESQQHDGVDKVVPLTLRVNDKLPRVGTVALNDGREAEHPADTGGQEEEEEEIRTPQRSATTTTKK